MIGKKCILGNPIFLSPNHSFFCSWSPPTPLLPLPTFEESSFFYYLYFFPSNNSIFDHDVRILYFFFIIIILTNINEYLDANKEPFNIRSSTIPETVAPKRWCPEVGGCFISHRKSARYGNETQTVCS